MQQSQNSTSPMLFSNSCYIPFGTPHTYKKQNGLYILRRMIEQGYLDEIHREEIRRTEENPRIRDAHEIEEITAALQIYTKKDFLKEMKRRQLRQNTDELRELQVNIRRAECTKMLLDQKAEVQAIRDEAIAQKLVHNKRLKVENAEAEIERQELEKKDREHKAAYKAYLFGQIDEKNRIKEKAIEQVKRDRVEMLKYEARLAKIIAAEQQEVIDVKAFKKREMDEFLLSQELYREKMKEAKRDEEAEFREILRKRDEEKRLQDELKQREFEKKQEFSEMMGRALVEASRAKREREEFLCELLIEERAAREDQRDEDLIEHAKQARIHAREEMHVKLHELRVVKEAKEAAEKKRQRDELEALVEELIQKEAENEVLRKKKAAWLKKSQMDTIALRRAEQEHRRQEELDFVADLNEQARQTQNFVNRERMRLLRREPREVLLVMPTPMFSGNEREILELPPGFR